jgi:polysaccharide export outer membrane protein
VVAISFALSPEFDQIVTVQPDGYISLLGAEDVQVRGLTIPGLVDALQKAYGDVLNHPIINVSLKDFQTPFFAVSGQVAKPGQFALRYETTVFEAIALAGGLTPAGKSHIFLFRRTSSGWFKVTPVNLSDIVAGKHVEDALLQPGDMVYVPEKFITKFRTYVPYSLGFYTSPQLVF